MKLTHNAVTEQNTKNDLSSANTPMLCRGDYSEMLNSYQTVNYLATPRAKQTLSQRQLNP